MAEIKVGDERQPSDQQDHHDRQKTTSADEEMMGCVVALEAALLPCLLAMEELQHIDCSTYSSFQFGGEMAEHAKEFMEAAKKLHLYFISLQREDQQSQKEILQKEISNMEEELKTKSDLIKKHEKLIQGWRKELSCQLDKCVTEVERV
ncbi:Mediator of RNA polymerase II transcription subunit 28 [Acorus gramineus]|uniref:Mediator of RNA polymerase II transcription subunit 28 n=1 Tax=Acorus gramineus TaxID=55184 RepID=A0AAV9BRT6_ACOGR|nr:Mediator of RNA polymerase II transcription subunit 28 [Acorus gramineus]